jgi:hypothetical protein
MFRFCSGPLNRNACFVTRNYGYETVCENIYSACQDRIATWGRACGYILRYTLRSLKCIYTAVTALKRFQNRNPRNRRFKLTDETLCMSRVLRSPESFPILTASGHTSHKATYLTARPRGLKHSCFVS